MAKLEQQDVLAAPVNEYPEVFSDPQVLHNGMIIDTQRADIGEFKLVGMPIKLSATPANLRLPPPTVGEHNVDILTAAGYSSEEIAALRAEGVIGAETEHQRAGAPPAWGSSMTAA